AARAHRGRGEQGAPWRRGARGRHREGDSLRADLSQQDPARGRGRLRRGRVQDALGEKSMSERPPSPALPQGGGGRKRKRLRSDIAWSNAERIVVRGQD